MPRLCQPYSLQPAILLGRFEEGIRTHQDEAILMKAAETYDKPTDDKRTDDERSINDRHIQLTLNFLQAETDSQHPQSTLQLSAPLTRLR